MTVLDILLALTSLGVNAAIVASLRPLTRVETVCTLCHAKRDNEKKQKSHCKSGHEFTPENTIIKPNGCRACRECRKAYDRKRGRDATYWRNYREEKGSVANGR